MAKKRQSVKKSRGGCGCNNKNNSKNMFQTGGNSLPIKYYYGSANIVDDPNDPSNKISSRVLGGKKIKRSKSKQTRSRKSRIGKQKYSKNTVKKMVGGTALLTNSMNTNTVTSFGTIDWPWTGTNILSQNSNLNIAPYSQPVDKIYGAHNPPLA